MGFPNVFSKRQCFLFFLKRGTKMKIAINPKARKALILIVILAVIAIVLLSLHSVIFRIPEVSETGAAPDAQAAVGAVTAFYTLDYTSFPELWLSNVCSFSTNQGCNAVRSFFAPLIQNQVQNYHAQTGCSALPVRLVEDNGDIRVWQISVTLDHPRMSLDTATQDVFVEVEKVQSRWLMSRIMFKQEIERFAIPTQ
jgi:hypothetical protein